MKKNEFIDRLRQITAYLPPEESEKYIEYYSEMIADAMEDGMSEEDAVFSLGTIEEIESYIKENNAPPPVQKYPVMESYPPENKTKTKRLPTWAIVLIVIGFPIWFSILAVMFSVYITLWAVVVSLYAVAVSIFAAGIMAIVAVFFAGNFASVMITLGAGLFCIGLSVLMFLGLLELTKAFAKLSVYTVRKCIGALKGE